MSYKISVAMCTYNGEKFVEEQIRSLLNQSRVPDEIIICDDNSSDRTLKRAKNTLENSGVDYRIISSGINIGVVKNFEKAISLCSGDIIFTCDQDDIWLNKKIEIIESKFIENTNCVLAFCDAELVDSQLVKYEKSLWESLGLSVQGFGVNNKFENILGILLKKCIVSGATMAFKSNLKDRILPLSENWIHDGWITIISYFSGDIVPIDEKLILYRQHSNNVIGAKNKGLLSKLRKVLLNFDAIVKYRIKIFNRYSDVLEKLIHENMYCTENDLKSLKNCVEFWERKTMLNKSSRFISIKNIISDLLNGSYRKYSNGVNLAIIDIISILIVQKRT
jgi:glycosyltransferase involved in cell wall biosynthesis